MKNHLFLPVLNFSSSSFLASYKAARGRGHMVRGGQDKYLALEMKGQYQGSEANRNVLHTR